MGTDRLSLRLGIAAVAGCAAVACAGWLTDGTAGWAALAPLGVPLVAGWLGGRVGVAGLAAGTLTGLAALGRLDAWPAVLVTVAEGLAVAQWARTRRPVGLDRPADSLWLACGCLFGAVARGMSVAVVAITFEQSAEWIAAGMRAAAAGWLANLLIGSGLAAVIGRRWPAVRPAVEGLGLAAVAAALAGVTLNPATMGTATPPSFPVPVVVLLIAFLAAARLGGAAAAGVNLAVAATVLAVVGLNRAAGGSPAARVTADWPSQIGVFGLFLYAPVFLASVLRERRTEAEVRTRLLADLKQVTADLAQKQAVLETVLEQLPVGVLFLDRDGNVARQNRQYRDGFGLPPDFPGVRPGESDSGGWRVEQPDGQPVDPAEWSVAKAVRSGAPTRPREARVMTPAGKWADIVVTSAPVVDPQAGRIGSVFVVADQTDRKQAERGLRAAQERFRFALTAGRMIAWEWNTATGEIRRSAPLEDWLGLPPSPHANRAGTFIRHIHPDDRPRIVAVSERLRAGTVRESDEDFRMRRADGQYLSLTSRSRAVIGADGKPTGWVSGVMIDVTDRARDQERLRLLESAVVHARDAIVVLAASPDGHPGRSVLYVNDAFTRMTGYAADEVIGRSLHFLRGPDSCPDTLDRLRDALEAGRPLLVELLNYRKDGTSFWVELSLVPVPDPAGRCAHFVMIQRDITDRKKAAEAVRQSEELFRGMFENAAAGVSLTDPAGTFVAVNPAFAAMLGRPAEEIIGRSPSAFTHPDDWTAQQPNLREMIAGRRPGYQVQKRYVRPDGRLVWTELSVAAVRGPDDQFLSALGVSVDVTERRLLEDQLRQAQKMEAIGQLAGGIAHDFNNLLTGVIGNLALTELPEDDPNRPLLATAEKAAQRAAELTRKLLGFARKNQLLLAPVRPAGFVAEVVDLLRHTLDPRIRLETTVTAIDPVAADPTLVQQALLNLCLNARDAMSHGGTLTITAAPAVVGPDDLAAHPPDARVGRYVRVSVADTGAGMTAEVKARIFEPFFTTKPVGQGTGLGLPMVHGIVRQHNGWVACESVLGRGTRFDLYLPVAGPAAPSASGLTRAPARPTADTPLPPPSAGRPTRTVLLVDDEELIRDIGRSVLEAAGYTVLEAGDGADAVELFRDRHPDIDLVILDLTMPRVSGRDAFQAITEIAPSARVLFSSGYSADDLSDVTGAVGLLPKPYRPIELVSAVRRALAGPHDPPPADAGETWQ